MQEKIKWRGGALLAPVPPVMVTCGTIEQPNTITIAWTGLMNTIPPKTYISVRPSRYSHPMIQEQKAFVINLTTESLVRAADFCGCRSGRDINKAEACGFTLVPSDTTNVPLIAESPVNLECTVTDIVSLGSHDMFLADITAVNVTADYVNADGKLEIAKCGLAAYAHGSYFALGKQLGTFGFSVRKKKKKHKPDKRARPVKGGKGR